MEFKTITKNILLFTIFNFYFMSNKVNKLNNYTQIIRINDVLYYLLLINIQFTFHVLNKIRKQLVLQ